MRLKFLAGAAALLLAAGAVAQTVPGANVDALMHRYVAEGKVPGVLVSVGKGDGPTHYFADGRVSADATSAKVDENTLWRVYSMTKPFTGMAAMILVEEGKLKLDQPISDFIPAFKTMRVMDDANGDVSRTHPATHPITVRNLLTHTAGLGYDLGQPDAPNGSLLALYREQGINPAQVNPAFEANTRKIRPPTLEAFANKVASAPLLYEPGTKWSYSIGLDVLGRVIEVASGMPFDKFLQTRIFDPLQMKSTYFTVPQSEAGRLVTNYAYINNTRISLDTGMGSEWLTPPSFPYGGAGLVMSAHDYDRFLHMLQDHGTLDGVRVMKPETVALGMSNLLPAGADTSMLGGLTHVEGLLGFGAGGSVYLKDAPTGQSKGTYGWGGAAGTLAWVDPVKNVRGTLMVNYMPSEHWPIRDDLYKAFAADTGR